MTGEAHTTSFDGVFMRPNLKASNEIPANGHLSACPDIWLAETTAIAGFQKVLAAPPNYHADSGRNLKSYADNYIYLRAANAAGYPLTKTVQLYHASSAVIQWPTRWESNVILTDRGDQHADLVNVASHAIAVADQTFVWKNVPPPPKGHDHYCLIAQINDAANSNPLPAVNRLLDLSALVQRNLGFGWRNIRVVKADQPVYEFTGPLAIALNFDRRAIYDISVLAAGWKGFDIRASCSQTDAQGMEIGLKKTRIDKDTKTLRMPSCQLDPGFEASVNLIVTKGDKSKRPKRGAKLTLMCSARAAKSQAVEAAERGLVDWPATQQLHALPSVEQAKASAPDVAIPLGSFTWIVEQ